MAMATSLRRLTQIQFNLLGQFECLKIAEANETGRKKIRDAKCDDCTNL